jgi:transcriptional regulator with XRE-family HTH domain
MLEITTWTGREARVLRHAMRMTLEEFSEVLDVAVRTVSYWESKGTRTKPKMFHQSQLDTLYGRLDERTRGRVEALLEEDRQNTADSSMPASQTSPAVSPESGLLLSVIRPSTVEQIHMAATTFSNWNHLAGSVSAAPAANAQMSWARSLIDIPCPGGLRRDFHASLAHLGLVAGFINFDAHSQDAASSVFEFALLCASEAGDPHLQVKVLSHQARQAIYCNRPQAAIKVLDRALRLPDLTATERAMLHTGRARASAKMGRVRETRADIRCADAEFERSDPAQDRPWMHYYDEAQHSGDTGHALFDLAVEGQFVADALERLQVAVEGHSGAYLRSKSMSALKVASLLFAVGDPHQAAAIAHRSLPELNSIGSGRVVDLLHELLRFSLVYSRDSEIQQVRHEVGVLLQ